MQTVNVETWQLSASLRFIRDVFDARYCWSVIKHCRPLRFRWWSRKKLWVDLSSRPAKRMTLSRDYRGTGLLCQSNPLENIKLINLSIKRFGVTLELPFCNWGRKIKSYQHGQRCDVMLGDDNAAKFTVYFIIAGKYIVSCCYFELLAHEL